MDQTARNSAARAGLAMAGALAGAVVLAHHALGVGAEQAIVTSIRELGPLAAWAILLSPFVALGLICYLLLHATHQRRELHERRAAQDHAATLARQDAQTGLLNRRGLLDGIEQLAPAVQARGQALALLMIDLDHFKKVNDLHGHMIGDALLHAVADRMARSCPGEALIARLGGDEFAVAIEYSPHSPVTIDSVAQALIASVGAAIPVGDLALHAGASIGIATTAQTGWDETALLRQSDVAMYRAKQAGRNCARWFDASMEADVKRRGEMEAELRVAIPRGEVVPYYEPQVDFFTGRVSGVEVLARWNHPVRGLVRPDHFIPVAEETGLIGELSFAVMEQAMIEARDWDAGIRLAVNISPTQLRDPLLAHRLLKLVVATRFPPDRLEVEITESALMGDLDTAKAVIISLKNQGIRLALDDFGTGYSSLHHLRVLPFDRIKIDRSFVTSILDNDESAAIVNAVLGLGESLGIDVIAEGIETRAIEARLRQLNCRNGQGYFYSRPVPADALAAVVDRVDANWIADLEAEIGAATFEYRKVAR